MTHNQLAWEETLTRAGCRVTRQRAIILDAVCAGSGHTTLSDIQVRVVRTNPSIDRSTIYRTLKLFVELGIVVQAVAEDDEPTYEVARVVHHHHLICRQCGHEQEIEGQDLAPLSRHLADHYGFTIETDHLMIFGICRHCSSSTPIH